MFELQRTILIIYMYRELRLIETVGLLDKKIFKVILIIYENPNAVSVIFSWWAYLLY